MSTSSDLAEELEAAALAFADYLDGLSPEQWRARCGNHPTIRVGDEDENRPVGAVARHTGAALVRQLAVVRAILAGEEVPQPPRGPGAQADDVPDQGDTVALVRRNAAEAADYVRGLSEEELGRRGRTMLGELTAAQAVSRVLVGHVSWHEGSIRATLGDGESAP